MCSVGNYSLSENWGKHLVFLVLNSFVFLALSYYLVFVFTCRYELFGILSSEYLSGILSSELSTGIFWNYHTVLIVFFVLNFIWYS